MTGFRMNKLENKWLKNQWLTLASLMLNLFLIGSIAGGTYKLFENHQAGKVGQNALRFAAENLSKEQQRSFKISLREARRDARQQLELAKEARTEVRKLIAAPSFDKQALETAFAKTREADRVVRMKIEVALINFTEKLTAEDRQKLADGLAQKGPLRQPNMFTLKEND